MSKPRRSRAAAWRRDTTGPPCAAAAEAMRELMRILGRAKDLSFLLEPLVIVLAAPH
jgi:hypothetical protein